MAIFDATNFRPAPLRASRGRQLAIGMAVVVALTAGGAALRLATTGSGSPWENAFADLMTSCENCLADGDAATRASSRLTRSQSQLEGFVRERFEQFRVHAALAQVEQQRAAAPASVPAGAAEPTEAARLQSRLTMLTGERWQLLERLMPEHPLVVDLSSQIADVERQLAMVGPDPVRVDPTPDALAAEPVPAVGWQALVEQSAAEYEQLIAAYRRAERQSDEAQVGQSSALDRHVAALEYWDEAATSWSTVSAGKQAALWILGCVTAAAMAMLAWLAASGTAGSLESDGDEVLTSVSQIERWFSVPAVSIGLKPTESHSAMTRPRRAAPRWLVLPAQFAMAIAVFALVAATIQNPSWLGEMASEPWQTIGQLWGR
jgi:hypothetical protein